MIYFRGTITGDCVGVFASNSEGIEKGVPPIILGVRRLRWCLATPSPCPGSVLNPALTPGREALGLLARMRNKSSYYFPSASSALAVSSRFPIELLEETS